MANDYLNIRCTFCGMHEWIAKYYVGGIDLYDRCDISVFLLKHFGCNPSVIDPDTHLSHGSGFEILNDAQMAKYRKEEQV